MGNRMEDEKIIRGLLKLPANKRCINCNNLGPQYVCTNFWTFICTNCSGMHREFTHRVKSISMAKFTSQEVSSLQACGNSRAKEIYFNEWDPQRHSYPDSSDIDSLRDFIRHVYVDRRYTGERGTNRSLRMKGHSQDLNENKTVELCHSPSRSPSYVDKRKDGYKLRCNSDERSPAYFEVVDERRRDRRNGNVDQNSKIDSRKLSNVISKPDGRSPDRQKDGHSSSLPIVHPVTDILGDDVPSIQVPEVPQMTASSTSVGSNDGNSASLIDFNVDSEITTLPQQNNFAPLESVDSTSFDVVSQQKPPQATTANANSLENVFDQSSFPGTITAGNIPTSQVLDVDDSVSQLLQNSEVVLDVDILPANPTSSASNNQLWEPSPVAPNMQSEHTSQAISGVISQIPAETMKPIGRKELPEDLFTLIYPSAPTSFPSWQRAPHSGMGYAMQYHVGDTMQAMPQSARSSNPFDLASESSVPHAPSFPSLASLAGTLPDITSDAAMPRSASVGALTPQWMMVLQQTSYLSDSSPSPYLMQHGLANMATQVPSNSFPIISQGAGLANFGMNQNPSCKKSQPNTPNSLASGGNPFG